MKITDIRTIRLRASLPPDEQFRTRSGPRRYRSAFLIQVETDEGVTGIGSCSGNGAILEAILTKVLKPLLLGRDPCLITELWDRIYVGAGVRLFGSRGIGVVALSGVDIALWDILGKVKNTPIHQLLSNSPRNKVELYATALYPDQIGGDVEKALSYAARGFRGVKIKLGFDLDSDLERVRAVRAAVGKEFPLMTDANMGYDLKVALRAIPLLRECGVGWLEEPLFVEDIDGHAELRSRSQVPIALGENLHTRFAFQEYILRGAVDILQPDVARAGGISEVKEIGTLAEKHGLPLSLHTYGDAVGLAASAHMAAALKNSTVMELDCTYNPLQTALLREPLKVQGGTLIPPQGPGLGIELDPDALAKYQYSGEEDLTIREAPLRGL
jgi:D-galactarolactone cycloisomerase